MIVIEKEPTLGGLASSFDINGKKIPRYYHHIFSHDNITQDYLKKAGILGKMNWKHIKMAICSGGKIYDFTNVSGLIRFKLLTAWGKIRYGIFGAYVFTILNPNKISEDLDAETWLLEYAGKEVTRKIFHELYAVNKFNIPLSQISAKQFASRLKAKEAIGIFGYPSAGLEIMINYLADSIKHKGGTIYTGKKIRSINLKEKEIVMQDKNIHADLIINTIPIPVFLKLAKGLPETYQRQLSKVKYCPVVGIVIGTKEFLGKHYWYNLLKERVNVIIQHSWLYDGYGEKISWASRYGGSEEDISLSDEEIKDRYLCAVKKYFPDVSINWVRVFKNDYAEPIYDKEFSRYKPEYCSPVKGLYMACTAVTYPEIRNMNTALKSGIKVAKVIREDI